MRLERGRLGHWRSMYLRHAPLDLPLHRQHSKPNARFFRSHLGSNDLFLYLLVNLYPTLGAFDPTMAYLDQDQARRLFPFLYWNAGIGFDCLGWGWRYVDQEGSGGG